MSTQTPDAPDQAAEPAAPQPVGFWRGWAQLIQAPAGTPWHRHPRVGIGLVLASTALTQIVGVLGPSVVTLTLGPREGSLLPPWYVPGLLKPDSWIIAGLGWLIIFVGAGGTWILLRALAVGAPTTAACSVARSGSISSPSASPR